MPNKKSLQVCLKNLNFLRTKNCALTENKKHKMKETLSASFFLQILPQQSRV